MPVLDFIHETGWDDLPADVQRQATRCLLDIGGVAIAGRSTELSRIIHNFSAANFAGRGAYLWLDGREVSPPGAALANGMTIDALDAHDGSNAVKGHAGAAVTPAVVATLALARGGTVPGRELLASLVVGYEIALRAGEALHATACDYHTSGAWNALGCAAVTARRLQLNDAQTRHALGIAEYHGPRSPMMRCIDFPTMVKDGSGWGAMAGVSAALMAHAGFTGAPAQTVESRETAAIWQDLGRRWRMADLYFKPHAVCRWAQPAIEAALFLQAKHGFPLDDVREIRVYTFAEAARLSQVQPQTTEEAQYSLPFPLAAALVNGALGAAQLGGAALHDSRVLALARRVQLIEAPAFSARFPAQRVARLEVERKDGVVLTSPEMEASWEQHAPPGDEALKEKFRRLAAGISPERVMRLETLLWNCDTLPDAGELVAELAPPPEASRLRQRVATQS
ncbi:MAG: MmgE/PrpD family protein [Chloroflexota bacterium]